MIKTRVFRPVLMGIVMSIVCATAFAEKKSDWEIFEEQGDVDSATSTVESRNVETLPVESKTEDNSKPRIEPVDLQSIEAALAGDTVSETTKTESIREINPYLPNKTAEKNPAPVVREQVATERTDPPSLTDFEDPAFDFPVIKSEKELLLAQKWQIPRVVIGSRIYVLEEDGKYHSPALKAQYERERGIVTGLSVQQPIKPKTTPTQAVGESSETVGTVTRDVVPPQWNHDVEPLEIKSEEELEKAQAMGIPKVKIGNTIYLLDENGLYYDPVRRMLRETEERRKEELMKYYTVATPVPMPTPTPTKPKGAPGPVTRQAPPPRDARGTTR